MSFKSTLLAAVVTAFVALPAFVSRNNPDLLRSNVRPYAKLYAIEVFSNLVGNTHISNHISNQQNQNQNQNQNHHQNQHQNQRQIDHQNQSESFI